MRSVVLSATEAAYIGSGERVEIIIQLLIQRKFKLRFQFQFMWIRLEQYGCQIIKQQVKGQSMFI